MALYANKFNPGAFEVEPHFHVKYVFHEKAAKAQLPAKPTRAHPLEHLLNRKPVTPCNREPAIMIFVVLSHWLKKLKIASMSSVVVLQGSFTLPSVSPSRFLCKASGSSNMHYRSFEGLLHLLYYIIELLQLSLVESRCGRAIAAAPKAVTGTLIQGPFSTK